jgi:hypothetical protein
VAWAAGHGHGRYDPIWNGPAELVAVAAIAALVWLVIELYLADGATWSGATGLEQRSPWTTRRDEPPAGGPRR